MAVTVQPKLLDRTATGWFEDAESSEKLVPAHCFEPLSDSRWNSFVERHPRASVFHSSAWLTALQRTYGYTPVAYTTSAPGSDLENAIVFCRVESWLTGRRLVSLPFSDHCEALVGADDDGAALLGQVVEREMTSNHWRYVELRPIEAIPVITSCPRTTIPYEFHQLNLRPDLDVLFQNFHKDSIQRKIRRAQREDLTYQDGSNDELLDIFYKLFKATRVRHQVPPPPRRWFANLMECFGPALKIRVAFQAETPIAAMVTIRHKQVMVYKYGCSNTSFNQLGGVHFLFWKVIQEAKSAGLTCLDFGRTDAHQRGLVTFKARWGAAQSALNYYRFGRVENATHFFDLSARDRKARAAKYFMSCLPARVVSKIGQMLYGHVG